VLDNNPPQASIRIAKSGRNVIQVQINSSYTHEALDGFKFR
jgi:hypothetical protein